MAPFFHKYSMVTDEIKLIRTKKEGDELLKVQENYPNSIIFVDSEKDKNVYIGSERVEQGYNVGVDGITNSVGGMKSGILASELKGKPISEILDIILFASNNNLTLKGVQVVDKIENLTDNTLVEVYQGMVVSVLEDNSLYILLTYSNSDSDNEREWKKVGSDIDDEKIKNTSDKLREPIKVIGLSEGLGGIIEGKTYETIEEILKDLLCKEIYPDVKLETVNPTITFGGIKGDIISNYNKIMEFGSVLELNPIELYSASISDCYRQAVGFDYGYMDNDGVIHHDNPEKINGSSSLVGDYKLILEHNSSNIISISSSDYNNVKLEKDELEKKPIIIELRKNKISLTATSPSGKYSHEEYPDYYVISNLGNKNKLSNYFNLSEVNKDLSSKEYKKNIEITGVYPVYVNIDDTNNTFVDDTIKKILTDSNEIYFDAPSEVEADGIHFTFDYPASHEVENFEVKDLSGNYVPFKSLYDKEFEIIDKVVGDYEENMIQYKRFKTTGSPQGKSTYKITLSKRLDVE